MRKTKKILAAFMAAAMTVTSFSNTAVTVLASQTDEVAKKMVEDSIDSKTYDYLALSERMEEEVQKNPQEALELEEIFVESPRADADSEGVSGDLPSALDWSQSEYFPAVGNQGSTGSCGYYSIFYMTQTSHINFSYAP